MSLWGIEVKPGKPITLYFDQTRARLRISQATLGIGSGVTKSLVQCNVRNKTPVFLCALLPDKMESCHLDLEFEEADDVVFSVLGPRSVHLTGYYVSKSLHRIDSDTESYGEDIANTDNEVSNQCSDEYDYDDSFINDDDPEVLPSSPASSDGDGGKHPGNRKGNRKRLKKKKKVVIDLEEDNNSQEIEDEDNCHSKIPTKKKHYVVESEDDNNEHESKGEESSLFSAFKNETPANTTFSNCREKTGKVTVEATCQAENSGSGEKDREENVDAVDMTSMRNISKDQFISGIDNDILAPENASRTGKTTMPSKFEDAMSLEVGVAKQEDMYTNCNTVQLTEFDKEHQVLIGTERVQEVASDMNIVDQSDSLEPPAEEQVENSPQLTKNGSEEMRLHECNDSSPGDDVKEVKQVVETTDMDKDLLATEDNELTSTQNIVDHSDSFEPHAEVKAENGPKLKKRKKGSEGVRLNECKDPSPGDAVEEVKLVFVATDMDTNLLVTTEDNKLPTSIHEKKLKKKKKKKTKVKDVDTSILESDRITNEIFVKSQDKGPNPESSQVTLSNGLIIDDLAKGKADGKVATPGRKVKVYYTGRLKENEHVFCSNIGKTAYKFCLGDKQVLEGFNIGIEGMRVGDKRRLTIPPTMGYGSVGLENDVPPNSWLIFDIELAGVRG